MLYYIPLALLFLGLIGLYFIRKTPYGLLDTRVALALKLIPERKPTGIPAKKLRADFQKIMQKQARPYPVQRVEDHTITIADQAIPIRVYSNHPVDNLPILVFYHGGGWVVGNIDTHDSICRQLAKAAKVLVISVEYRLAPEHPYPIPFNDAYNALVWISKNGDSLGGNPQKIAVAGDSAGGNLAAAVALKSKAEQGPKITYQALIYPVTNLSQLNTASYQNFEKGFFLSKEMMSIYIDHYTPDVASRQQAYASPLLADTVVDLPPALIITAGFDPLCDEGEAYGKRLQAAGVPTDITCYKGTIHGFFGLAALGKAGTRAVKEVGAHLERAFA